MRDISNLSSNILREIGALSRTIHSISDIKFKEINLQKGQFIFLTRICENPGTNMIDLSNILKVDKTTTTKAAQKLISEGYIDKRQDELDKRIYRLYPTQKALNTYKFVIDEENDNIKTCFLNFTEEEKSLVCELVKKMRLNIEDEWYKTKNYKE